ncbi:DUF4440 domain-containing protein [Gallaecimonas kandeliae]|uniref:nuclear transport factor 2 family protein n=1 Tax=Gallaecimonas kandeliae TaxID=3029055 RepID=UPI0026486CA4|nr:DUF4440 domain-containing protein [Gallaecimonas kandeliae]WKE65385.1 DUF4440 domain-containing protein [Gallaecimonas kandeliae]
MTGRMDRHGGWFVGAGLLAVAWAAPTVAADKAEDLSALLKRQTQAFSEAGQVGDAATMARYLDDKVVFTVENGGIFTKKDIVDGASPLPGERHIEVTKWQLVPQGDVATATFVDHLTMAFHGQTLVYDFQSTETWAKRPDGWKMISSHTMVVPKDPPALKQTAAELDAYVGTYALDTAFKVRIWRDGDQLFMNQNGGDAVPLKVEIRDVLFTPGAVGRRLFERNAVGQVTGFISRKNGSDMHLKKEA